MKRNITNLIILIIPFLYSCQSNKININEAKDKAKVDSIINIYYDLEKDRDYDKMFELFTLGNSKLSRHELNLQLKKVFETTVEKSEETKNILSKTYKTEVRTNSKDTVGLYEATIDMERSLLLTRETFKMMLEKGSIKIYDYHIATKTK